jgi:hypothetical protein
MKNLITLVVLTTAAIATTAGLALASPAAPTLDHQAVLPTQCNGHGSTLVVDVTFDLVNDADSGFAGNEWANDSIHRKLQIWNTGDDTYCAVATDTGSFVTVGGPSPSGNASVPDGVTGTIHGGYVATFTGTPLASPAYASSGDLGTFDLQCTTAYDCPGDHPSYASYFDVGNDNGLVSWGWIYRTAQNGVWVNQASGSSGDITG